MNREKHAVNTSACFSRFMFVYLTFSMTLEEVIAGCEDAWVFFGGVFAVVIPDNMSPVVAKADAVSPRLTREWLEYARARGFVTDPARIRHPRDKPLVAYCTSSGRSAGRWRSCRSLGVVSASLVEGRRVGAGRLVEDFAFVVIPLPGDNSGVVPDLDGGGGHAEQRGHLVKGDQAGVEQPLAAAG